MLINVIQSVFYIYVHISTYIIYKNIILTIFIGVYAL